MAEGPGGEKTEKATDKKRRDTREQGNVLKSAEINTAVSVLVMFGALKILGGMTAERVIDNAREIITNAGTSMAAADYQRIFSQQVFHFLLSIAPFLVVALIVGVAVNVVQVGFLFTTKTLAPKFSKINPMSGFKRLFSIRALSDMVKSILKIAIIGIIVYNELKRNVDFVVFLTGKDTMRSIDAVFDLIVSLGLKVGMALAAIGVVDFAYQWWRYEKDIMMTKQEVKEEYKMTEGNPEIKGKIKQKQRQMGMMRMMQSVPEADVVITNPTHYAVAIKYEDGVSLAPTVLAKGQDNVARRIKEIAAEHKVEIVENKPVAQALFRLCEVGEQVPEQMYKAVAEILAYVYNRKKGRA